VCACLLLPLAPSRACFESCLAPSPALVRSERRIKRAIEISLKKKPLPAEIQKLQKPLEVSPHLSHSCVCVCTITRWKLYVPPRLPQTLWLLMVVGACVRACGSPT
jgi:hypothetical protein